MLNSVFILMISLASFFSASVLTSLSFISFSFDRESRYSLYHTQVFSNQFLSCIKVLICVCTSSFVLNWKFNTQYLMFLIASLMNLVNNALFVIRSFRSSSVRRSHSFKNSNSLMSMITQVGLVVAFIR